MPRPLLAALAALLAPSAPVLAAGPPDPAHCTVPAFVSVVGTQYGVPDPSGTFTVTLRDATHAPCPGISVTVDFSGCSDVRLALVQAPGAVLLPGSNGVRVPTDDNGVATFRVVGAGIFGCPTPAGPGPCARICAAGMSLGLATANIFDLDGASGFDGVDGREINIARQEVLEAAGGGGAYHGRIDFSQDGALGLIDLSFYIQRAIQPSLQRRGSGSGSNGAGFLSGPFTPVCP